MNARLTLASIVALSLVTGALQAQPPAPYPYPPQPPPAPYPYPPQPYPQPQYPYPQPYPYPPPYPYPQPYPYPPQPYPQPQYPYPQPYPQPPSPPAPPEPKKVGVDHLVVEPIYPLIVGGVISFVLAYSVPLIAAGAQGFQNGGEWLAIPLAGPFVTIGEREWGDCPRPDECNDDLVGAGLAMSAIFQAAGVAMFLPGVLIKREKIEKVYAVAPIVTDDFVGMGATLSF